MDALFFQHRVLTAQAGSLYHTMKKFGVFPEQLVCCYCAQSLLALEYLHAQGVLHRDIKVCYVVLCFVLLSSSS